MTAAQDLSRVSVLSEADREEVLRFLNARPVHAVVMTSFINDNGFESDLNRGRFYGYRSAEGELEGVALIGHSTLLEARSDDALNAFAFIAKSSETPVHMVMSSGDNAERFWKYFSNGLRKPRLSCTELLFEVAFPFLVKDCKWRVRPATADELDQVAEAQAEVALLESGVCPLERDREGFMARVLRRIKQGRVFVVVEGGKLLFKADIVAETNEVIYLEGVYVSPEYRGRGIGSSCLANLSLSLFERAQTICLLSNLNHMGAHRSFRAAGFQQTGKCLTLFV